MTRNHSRAGRAGRSSFRLPGRPACAALLAATIFCPALSAAPADDEPVAVMQVSHEFDWGWRTGLKQPLGSYMNGWSIHQITQSIHVLNQVNENPNRGNPDNILWVNEASGEAGVSERPVFQFIGWTLNAGGSAQFGPDGRIWYAWGGRAVNLPLDLFVSDAPFDVEHFSVVLDDFSAQGNSTAPAVHLAPDRLFLAWRHKSACCEDPRIRVREYELTSELGKLVEQHDVGRPMPDHPVVGDIGIEQYWTRYDPRHQILMASWLFSDYSPVESCDFGSSPFLYYDGDHWRRPDHVIIDDQLPLQYTDMSDVLMPVDHLQTPDQELGWALRDIGVTPNGTFFLTLPSGDARVDDDSQLQFWRFADGSWEPWNLTGGMQQRTRSHATGVTQDYVFCVYSEYEAPNELKIRVSEDDGATWGTSFIVDAVAEDEAIAWVSLVQPASNYEDNLARVFYGHYKLADGDDGKFFLNAIKWARVDLERIEEMINFADLDRDGDVDVADLLELLGSWGSCGATPGCIADLSGDDTVDSVDLLQLLLNWG